MAKQTKKKTCKHPHIHAKKHARKLHLPDVHVCSCACIHGSDRERNHLPEAHKNRTLSFTHSILSAWPNGKLWMHKLEMWYGFIIIIASLVRSSRCVSSGALIVAALSFLFLGRNKDMVHMCNIRWTWLVVFPFLSFFFSFFRVCVFFLQFVVRIDIFVDFSTFAGLSCARISYQIFEKCTHK